MYQVNDLVLLPKVTTKRTAAEYYGVEIESTDSIQIFWLVAMYWNNSRVGQEFLCVHLSLTFHPPTRYPTSPKKDLPAPCSFDRFYQILHFVSTPPAKAPCEQ